MNMNDFAIQTLFQAAQGKSHHEISDIYALLQEKNWLNSAYIKFPPCNCRTTIDDLKLERQRSLDSESDGEECREVEEVEVTDKELGIKYQVKGLRSNEKAVIGTYVDGSILPGFCYKVRLLGSTSDKYLFNGKPLMLQSIGMGYGKRITFTSPKLNHNNNYFYSDTHAQGYGFQLVAVHQGQRFRVLSDEDERLVAMAEVVATHDHQQEIESSQITTKDDVITKRVVCDVTVMLHYQTEQHGVLSLRSNESLRTRGVATVAKRRGHRKGQLQKVTNVILPTFGVCTLEPKSVQ